MDIRLKAKDSAVCFLFSQDGKRMLMSRRRHGPDIGRLDGIAGDVRLDETPPQGALRIIREKTDIELVSNQLHWLSSARLPMEMIPGTYGVPRTVENHYYAAVIDPAAVKQAPDEATSWEETDWIMHARPQDERLAGNGAIPGLVATAVSALGFDVNSISVFYNILIGEDGDDYLYEERVPAHEVNAIKDKINKTLKQGAYIKVVPYN